jgi:hypothetical protein
MEENTLDKENEIKLLVANSIKQFAAKFKLKHENQVNDLNGVINRKIHNIFIAELGEDIKYYSALVRSFDSSLGKKLESLAIDIAKISFFVKKEVNGKIGDDQKSRIAKLISKYKKKNQKQPTIDDYQFLRRPLKDDHLSSESHESDYYLIDKETKEQFLIELKIGGDLDTKKAPSEKQALLEQFAILSSTLAENKSIKIFFATGYNRYGEGNQWKQSSVRKYFADEELLIGSAFWNFICKMDNGYKIVIESYKENAHFIRNALEAIKSIYLN